MRRSTSKYTNFHLKHALARKAVLSRWKSTPLYDVDDRSLAGVVWNERSFTSTPVVSKSPSHVVDLPPNYRFKTQSEICKSRKERREVLFAKGRQGGNHRPPTYTLYSFVRC